jgi:uncharacterized membrane protein required for colicin V production
MEFLNQYSFTLVAGTMIVLFSAFIFRQGIGQRQITALVALILGFLVAYRFFNPGESSTGGAERAQSAIGSGTPILLEFQSPY